MNCDHLNLRVRHWQTYDQTNIYYGPLDIKSVVCVDCGLVASGEGRFVWADAPEDIIPNTICEGHDMGEWVPL